jgi:hypothetical protein
LLANRITNHLHDTRCVRGNRESCFRDHLDIIYFIQVLLPVVLSRYRLILLFRALHHV